MDTDIPYLLACAGSVLVMVLFWAYYILDVRKEPRSEEWYDSGDVEGGAKDGPLFLYPYGEVPRVLFLGICLDFYLWCQGVKDLTPVW